MKNKIISFINEKLKNKVKDDLESIFLSSTANQKILFYKLVEQINIKDYLKCKNMQDKIKFIVTSVDSQELLIELLESQKDNKDIITEITKSLINKYDITTLLFNNKLNNKDSCLLNNIIQIIIQNKDKQEEMLSHFIMYDDRLKAIILINLRDSIKEEKLNDIKTEEYKIQVITSFQNDNLKIKYIENEQNENNKYLIIHSLKDKQLKKKYLNHLKDQYKIKLLDDFDETYIKEYLKNNTIDEKMKYEYCKKKNYQDILLDTIINGSDIIKYIFIKDMNSEEITLKFFPLIKDNNIKCNLINTLDLSIDTIIRLLDFIENDDTINLKENKNITDKDIIILYDKLNSTNAKKNLLPLLKKEPSKGFIYTKLKELIISINKDKKEAEEPIYIMDSLYQNNEEFYLNTNLNLFKRKYFNKLINHKSFFFLLTRYYNYANLIIDIIDNKEYIYDKLESIIKILYNCTKRIDDKLFIVLKTLYDNDITNIEDKELPVLIYNIIKNPILKLSKENSNNYEKLYNEYLDNKITEENDIESLKKLFYERYYKLTNAEVQKLLKEFNKDLNRLIINDDELKYINVINCLSKINGAKDKNELFKIVNSTELTIRESIQLEEKIKDIYIRNFKNNLLKLDTLTNKKIKLYNIEFTALEVNDDFNLLIHSTNAVNNMELKEHNYYKSWNENKNETNHTISCCHISNNNFRCASSKGVIFGFTNFENESLLGMLHNDMGTLSQENEINVTKFTSNYCLNDTLDKETTGYSEVILERNVINNEKINKLKPDCVVIFNTTDENDLIKSILAAKQLNIPIVYIDKQKFFRQAINKKVQDIRDNSNNKEKVFSDYIELLLRYDLPISQETMPKILKKKQEL